MIELSANQRAEVFMAYLKGEDISKFGYTQEILDDIIMRFEEMEFEEEYEYVDRDLFYVLLKKDNSLVIEARDHFDYVRDENDGEVLHVSHDKEEMVNYFNDYCQKIIDANANNS